MTPVTTATERHESNGSELEGQLRLWEAIDEIHRGQKAMLSKMGELTTAVEKDQHERRSFTWLQVPVWLAVLALDALAAAAVYSVLHG